jgi:hypothetical protein
LLQVTDLDAKISRQTELLYAAEFNLQQLERKVARAGGERSDEEKRLLNLKIEQLTVVLVKPCVSVTFCEPNISLDELYATR